MSEGEKKRPCVFAHLLGVEVGRRGKEESKSQKVKAVSAFKRETIVQMIQMVRLIQVIQVIDAMVQVLLQVRSETAKKGQMLLLLMLLMASNMEKARAIHKQWVDKGGKTKALVREDSKLQGCMLLMALERSCSVHLVSSLAKTLKEWRKSVCAFQDHLPDLSETES